MKKYLHIANCGSNLRYEQTVYTGITLGRAKRILKNLKDCSVERRSFPSGKVRKLYRGYTRVLRANYNRGSRKLYITRRLSGTFCKDTIGIRV